MNNESVFAQRAEAIAPQLNGLAMVIEASKQQEYQLKFTRA